MSVAMRSKYSLGIYKKNMKCCLVSSVFTFHTIIIQGIREILRTGFYLLSTQNHQNSKSK